MKNKDQPIAKLLWQTENVQQELLLWQGDVVTIGRGDSSTIQITSARVSRNHARIDWAGDHFVIRDLNSSNGTFVNDRRLDFTPWVLGDGDSILVERFPMRFETTQLNNAVQETNPSPVAHPNNQVPHASTPLLVVTEGPDKGREIFIHGDGVAIGRENQTGTWDVGLKDETVSRPHARIERQEDGYMLIDLGSTNGTTVNQSLVILPVRLFDGDIIGMGATRLLFRFK